MAGRRVGIQLHPQHTTYQEYAEAMRAVEDLGVDTIWTWDHFFPCTATAMARTSRAGRY